MYRLELKPGIDTQGMSLSVKCAKTLHGVRHASGTIVSYAEDAWDVYWYEKNLQGDIVAVYNEAGTKLISYEYDAYGRSRSMQYSGGYSTTAYNNPFRYRGYYYDEDIGLYYLNSRYYDAYTGRFISADGEISGVGGDIQGYNLYSYCFNNPVNMDDPTGQWPKWVGKAIAIVAVTAVVVAAVAVTVSTFGAGSLAGVTAISAASTIAARATEVAILQVKKSKNSSQNSSEENSGNFNLNSGNSSGDGDSNTPKSNTEVAIDVIESLFDNGFQIIGPTLCTKSGSIAFEHALNIQYFKIFGETATFNASLSGHKGIFAAIVFNGYAWYNTTMAILSEDPVERAEKRWYKLK